MTIRYGIIQSTTGIVDSGACYPGCSASNVAACQPIEFTNESDFRYYCSQHGETPVILGTAVPNSTLWNQLRNLAFEDCGVQTAVILPTIPGPPSGTSLTSVNVVPGYIPPPGTPTSDGGVPTGQVVGQGTQATALQGLYRFILHDPTNPAGPWSTGANYPGCSKVNMLNCQAKAFQTLQEAIDYAHAHGEIPYQVFSNQEAWDLMSGLRAINPQQILGQGLSFTTIAIVAAALWFLSGR